MSLEMKYFVLKPRAKCRNDPHATASQQALRLYAVTIRPYDESLADSLLNWADTEANRQQALPRSKAKSKT